MLATVDGAKPISSKIPQIQAAARMMLRKGMAHLLRRINLEKGSTNLSESRTPHRLPSGSLMLDACRLPIHDKDGARSRKLHAIEPTAIRKLFQLHAISGNSFETLRGDRAGQHCIRINDQYRLSFVWIENAAHDVEIVDYH
jgi:toxin HigB-1